MKNPESNPTRDSEEPSNDEFGERPSRTGGGRAVLAVAAVALALFAWLGRADLLNPDEGRHAEIAREMSASGRWDAWFVPHIHGKPYYDKPALFHWSVAAAMKTLGPNAGAARLPSALAALLTIMATVWWARRAYGAAAAVTVAAMMASTPFFIALGRFVVVDMMLTAALTAAFVYLGLRLLDPPGHKRSPYPFYALVGIGALVKGPVAIALAAPVAVVAGALEGRLAGVAELRPVRGGMIALAVAGPWYAAAWVADPRYVETFLAFHNVARFAGVEAHTHHEPWYYFLLALPVALLPWSAVAVPAVAARLTASARTKADVYTAAWAAVVVVFFSASSTKIVTYMLPAVPPLLCLAAASAHDPARRAMSMGWAHAARAWTLAAGLTVGAASIYVLVEHREVAGRLWLALPSTGLAYLAWREWRQPVASDRSNASLPPLTAVAASTLALMLFVYGAGADVLNRLKSQRPAAALVRRALTPGGDLACYDSVPHALGFYSDRVVRRTKDPRAALRGLNSGFDAVLLTKERKLDALGLVPLPAGLIKIWAAPDGYVAIATSDVAARVETARSGLPGSR